MRTTKLFLLTSLISLAIAATASMASAAWFESQIALDSGAWIADGHHLVADSEGRLHLIFERNQDCFHAIMENYTWVEQPTQLGSRFDHPRLAVDSQDRVHLVAVGSSISYMIWNGVEWLSVESPALTGGNFPAIALDGADNAHVFWSQDVSGSQYVHHRIWNGDAWSPARIASGPAFAQTMPAATADAKGMIHVTCRGVSEEQGKHSIHWAVWDGFGWSDPVDLGVPPASDIEHLGMESDSRGFVHLVWKSSASGIERVYYMFWDRFVWSEPELLPVLGTLASAPSLCVDSSNIPHVASRTDLGPVGSVATTSRTDGAWTPPLNHGDSFYATAITWDRSRDALHLTYGGDGVVLHRMEADLPAPILTSLWPDTEPRGDLVGVAVEGAEIVFPDSAWLESSLGTVPAQLESYSPTGRATLSLDLDGADPGKYDLVLQNGDGQTGMVVNGYEVLPTLDWSDPAVGHGAATHIRLTLHRGLLHAFINDSGSALHAIQGPNGWETRYLGLCDSYYEIEGDELGVHIVYRDDASRIQYRFWADGDYLIADSPGVNGHPFALAVDPGGVPNLILQNDSGSLKLWRRPETGWEELETVSDGPSGTNASYPELVFFGNDAHVAWQDNRNGNGDVFYRLRDDGVWRDSEQVSPSESDDRRPRLGLDVEGVAHVVWSYGNELRYSRRLDGVWQEPIEPDTEAESAVEPSISTDTLGNVHLVWRDSRTNFGEVFYRRWNGVAWTESVQLSQYYPHSYRPTIATSSDGDCYVGWIQDSEFRYSERFRTPKPKPIVSSVVPPIANNFGTVELTVSGSNWALPVQFRLQRQASDCRGVVVESAPSGARVRFDVTDLEVGAWDLEIEAADGQRDTLRARLEVRASAWSDEVGIGADPAPKLFPASNATPAVTTGPDAVGIFWADWRDGTPEIYFKERLSGLWGSDQPMTASGTASLHPTALATSSGVLFVAWQEVRDGVTQILARRRIGTDWTEEAQVTFGTSASLRPSLCSLGDESVLLVWQGNVSSDWEILYSVWDGTSWSVPAQATDISGDSVLPSVASDGAGGAYVAWLDDGTGYWDVLHRHFDGVSWGEVISVRHDPSVCRNPTLAASATEEVFLFWEDERHGDPEIYFSRVDSAGIGGRVTDDPLPSRHPHAKVQSDGTVHVVWSDLRTGAPTVFMKELRDGEWSPAHRVSSLASSGEEPFVVSGGVSDLEIVWIDNGGSTIEIHGRGRAWEPTSDFPDTPVIETLSVEATPNPMRRSIRFSVPDDRPLSVTIFDVSGRLVSRIYEGHPSTTGGIDWDGRDQRGRLVKTGSYFYRVNSGGRETTGRLVILR